MPFLGIDPAIITILVFLIGLLAGRVWGYYKYRDRLNYIIRKIRSSSSYVLGISNLIAGERELAISELARAAKTDTDRIELYIILGNLYREKGRLEKAIQIHRSVLHRRDLSPVDIDMTQLALGLDFLKAGMIKRAREIFEDILKENQDNVNALLHLQKTFEEERNWEEAFRVRQRIMRINRSSDYSVSAFILAEAGIDKYREGKFDEAIKFFDEAISLHKGAYSAYEFLGKTYLEMGRLRNAAEAWEKLIEIVPEKAFLVLDDLYKVYSKLGTEEDILQFTVEKESRQLACSSISINPAG
jgi:lipopolysaccharide biosynthesis regulator YciM